MHNSFTKKIHNTYLFERFPIDCPYRFFLTVHKTVNKTTLVLFFCPQDFVGYEGNEKHSAGT